MTIQRQSRNSLMKVQRHSSRTCTIASFEFFFSRLHSEGNKLVFIQCSCFISLHSSLLLQSAHFFLASTLQTSHQILLDVKISRRLNLYIVLIGRPHVAYIHILSTYQHPAAFKHKLSILLLRFQLSKLIYRKKFTLHRTRKIVNNYLRSAIISRSSHMERQMS